ncbi:anaerobic dehydrogenase, typically selenocysteine-containing [Desulfitobacterium dehalogenans ATCC 51507]|uniref:Anaerobic dehydrogenase, typically selenocysteine-containing n=1 Tax=Desulfitobacterium dehalogenans (strain ATCC 51507 / DSM 9161 / JW/IU-DC1) TaxID=756499 RepID=I4A941_DESDJ|nr:molybdopterin-dependent oxidoreductase [Desulfitobacterium dehalogenans]AFM00476.1 anaerobic dehydrogenase, typically selenocysteine-containing [Desulfitobacterium dehalogenans ATCC 51507]
MGEWKKSGCILCAQNCGLELEIEKNHIIKVRGDKDNPRSLGYCCRKGLRIAHYARNGDRLHYPLKKVGDHHERISWEQAIGEISEKLLSIKEHYGPKSFAYVGGGNVGGQMEVGTGLRLLSFLGSRYYYSSLAQEFSNVFWVDGRIAGKQGLTSMSDAHRADTLVAWGWNGWMSHQEPRTRILLKEFAENPQKKLIVIDPRLSETAKFADIHLALRPGSDTLLLKAIIRIILDQEWEDKKFIEDHVNGWDEVAPLFNGFESKRAVEEVCGLNYEDVVEVARVISQTKSCIHQDLGIYMNRNSTINNYLLHILRAMTGRLAVEGGQIFPAFLYPMGSDSDERNPKTWRTVKHKMFPVLGVFPPTILPDEIISDHPERIRAMIVSACNPLRSWPDTLAYEKAFQALELSVCIDIAYTETARLCDYILPSLSYLESYDTTCFNYSYPEFYFQMRQPVLEPISPEAKEGSAIILELIKAMGFLPQLPDSLYEAGKKGITPYLGTMNAYLMENPQYARFAPLILAETLGKALGSVNQALIVGLLINSSKAFKTGAVAMGYPADMTMVEKMFQDILEHPQGLVLAKFQGDNFQMLRTEDKKLALKIEELFEPLQAATIDKERADLKLPENYPLILHAGLHHETVANTMMRNPQWNGSERWATMLMNEADAKDLGISDGDKAKITTKASAAEIEVEISPYAAQGCVYIRHGGGLIYEGTQYGVNVNELVHSTDRDEMCTPIHRRIPCRVEVKSSK